jgi:uncharacterized protein YndB with AHSA1/START domain
MPGSNDQIQKKVLLSAKRERVWRAISDSKEFGTWFGVELEGPFAPGARLKAKIVPTKVDPEVARKQESYSGKTFDFFVDRIEPMRLFSYRWHPYAVDSTTDYSKEPTTLVVFELEEAPGGTLLTITESGFDQIPLDRRAKAFESNSQGWQIQTQLIGKYLAQEVRRSAAG